jgi:hypothetical protein
MASTPIDDTRIVRVPSGMQHARVRLLQALIARPDLLEPVLDLVSAMEDDERQGFLRGRYVMERQGRQLSVERQRMVSTRTLDTRLLFGPDAPA